MFNKNGAFIRGQATSTQKKPKSSGAHQSLTMLYMGRSPTRSKKKVDMVYGTPQLISSSQAPLSIRKRRV